MVRVLPYFRANSSWDFFIVSTSEITNSAILRFLNEPESLGERGSENGLSTAPVLSQYDAQLYVPALHLHAPPA